MNGGRCKEGMDCGIHRRHGGVERRLKLAFCCNAREEPEGLDLLKVTECQIYRFNIVIIVMAILLSRT